MLLKDLFKESLFFLKERQIENAKQSLEDIIAFVLNCKRLEIYFYFEKKLTHIHEKKIFEFVKRRGVNEPLEYILNTSIFYNSSLYINKDVLIPRMETEQLVDLVKNNIADSQILFELCTGSGCIAINLKKLFPKLKVYAGDICEKALTVAKKNADLNNVFINLIKTDLFSNFKKKCDVFVCNPPYVSKEHYDLLDNIKFEPKKALVADDNGLFFYKKLAKILPKYLNPRAKVFFEMGFNQAEDLKNIFRDKIWVFKKVYKDYFGKDRFFSLEIK